MVLKNKFVLIIIQGTVTIFSLKKKSNNKETYTGNGFLWEKKKNFR